MMKQEFEALVGYEVSTEDYNNIIEPMYMATELSKAEFVKVIDRKRFALKSLKSIIKEMRKMAKQLEETCTHYTDYDTKDAIEALAKEYVQRKYMGSAVCMHEEMKQTCYYPKSIEIFDPITGKTIEEIALI